MLSHVLAFTIAAALLTIAPGLDTALVIRTSMAEGRRQAFLAGLGIAAGCFTWGLLAAAGLGALLAASQSFYNLIRFIGAAYLFYLGVKLVLSQQRDFSINKSNLGSLRAYRWFFQGFLTNFLNPKVGVFYVSFLPQFIPDGANVSVTAAFLTAIHAALGIAWFAVLIGMTRPVLAFLTRGSAVIWLDRATGGLFIAFGAKLALSNQ